MALAGQSGDNKATVSGWNPDRGCRPRSAAGQGGLAAAEASGKTSFAGEGAKANVGEVTAGSDLPAGGARSLLVFALAEACCALRRPDIYLGLLARSALAGRLARVALPETGDEKFAWRKYFDRDPRLVVLCDKLAAKEWVRGLAPDLDIPETLWTGTSTQSVPFDLLGPETVLKANHATGMNMFFGDTLPEPIRNSGDGRALARPVPRAQNLRMGVFRRSAQALHRTAHPREISRALEWRAAKAPPLPPQSFTLRPCS